MGDASRPRAAAFNVALRRSSLIVQHSSLPRGELVYGLGIAKGLKQTFAHLFHKPVTAQFPEEVRPIPVP
jgi:hypothetical protein